MNAEALPGNFEEKQHKSKDIGDLELLRRDGSSSSENDLDDFPASVKVQKKDSLLKESTSIKGLFDKRGGSNCLNDSEDFYDETNKKVRSTPVIFKKAKFVMKPLNQFLEERPKDKISASTNAKEKGSILGKSALPAGGILQLGFGKQQQQSLQQSAFTTTPKKLILSSATASPKQYFTEAFNSESGTTPKSQNFTNFPTSTSDSSKKKNNLEDFLEDEVERNQDGTQIRNIFKENVDLKSKQVTPLFDTGPRYDKNSELLKYSIVGKPEWYKKVDFQKNGNKLTTKNIKIANGANTTTNTGTKQNFDMKSVVSKQNNPRKNTMKVGEGQTNIDGETGVQQIVTKDHLLMKFAEIERRIHTNTEENEQKHFKHFQDQMDDSKQQRYLATYEDQCEKWVNTAASILHRQEQNHHPFGLRTMTSMGNTRRYQNYHREHLEDTLLIRSEDVQRLKKEQNEYLEYIKEPFEVVGQKNLWESMLRNDDIDITTKYSQKRKLKNYFFPRETQVPFDKSASTRELTSFTKSGTFYQSSKDQQTLDTEGNEILAQDVSPKKRHLFRQLSQTSSLLHPPQSQKIDLTFRKADFNNRELSNTNGARVITGQNYDLLEAIRTPRIIQQQSLANRTIRSTPTKEKSDSIGQTFSRATLSNATLGNSEKKKWSIIKPNGAAPRSSYLDYFTQSELESIAIQGENKFESERNTIRNDGKQNFETYQLVVVDEKKLKGMKSQKDLRESQKLSSKPNEEQQKTQLKQNAHVSFTQLPNSGLSRNQSSVQLKKSTVL